MLKMSQYELIKTAHRVYGKSIRAIAKEYGHSRKTVRKALREVSPRYERKEALESPAHGPIRGIAQVDLRRSLAAVGPGLPGGKPPAPVEADQSRLPEGRVDADTGVRVHVGVVAEHDEGRLLEGSRGPGGGQQLPEPAILVLQYSADSG